MAFLALIVGAGPTGLTLAHELARHGVPVRIVEKRPERSATSRALAIHARILEIFGLMGVADPFLAAGLRLSEGRLHSGSRLLARVSFVDLPSRHPFVLTLPQSETERILEETLARRGVLVERQVELASLRLPEAGERSVAVATLRRADGREEEVAADWLVGCDGAHSTVRHLLGLPFTGAPYADPFLLADVRIGGDLFRSDSFGLFTGPRGLLALFPFGDGRCRVIASAPPDYGPEPTLAQCQEHVDRLSPAPGAFPLSDPVWTALFRIHHRSVPFLRRGPVFLAGDAAHIHSPAGGQGMNTGIQDAFNLGWKIGLVASGAGNDTLLDTYETERLPIDRAIVRQTDLLTRIATLRSPLARAARDLFLPVVASLSPLRARAVGMVSQVALRYRPGPLVEDHGPFSGTAAGCRAPDLALRRAGEGSSSLFAHLQRGRCLLLLPHASTIPEALAVLVKDFPIEVLALRSGESGDRDEIERGYGSKPSAVLIRPDGVIGFRAPLEAAPRLLPAYLARLFRDR